MKTNLIIDEEIVLALNFSNLVLLDQCFHHVNYPMINSRTLSTKKHKQTAKSSKFEKVNKNKNKQPQNNIDPLNKFNKITLQQPKTKMQLYDYNQTFSKIKICSDDPIDIFSNASFSNNFNNYYTPSKNQQYTVNDFINQTAISSSKKVFSPINAWKTSSVQKYHPNNFQISTHSQMNFTKNLNAAYNYGSFIDNSVKQTQKSIKKQGASSSTKSVSKKGKKFQKCGSSKMAIDKKEESSQLKCHEPQKQRVVNQILKEQKIQYQSIYIQKSSKPINKKQQQLLSHIQAIKQQKQYDNQTRDTCELEASKLQKLIQVDDNKYKQIVLKTFYKHQK